MAVATGSHFASILYCYNPRGKVNFTVVGTAIIRLHVVMLKVVCISRRILRILSAWMRRTGLLRIRMTEFKHWQNEQSTGISCAIFSIGIQCRYYILLFNPAAWRGSNWPYTIWMPKTILNFAEKLFWNNTSDILKVVDVHNVVNSFIIIRIAL